MLNYVSDKDLFESWRNGSLRTPNKFSIICIKVWCFNVCNKNGEQYSSYDFVPKKCNGKGFPGLFGSI